MYSSLDRVDIVTTGPDGQQRDIQTDHRSAAEIEAEPELSVVFALIRVLNPLRMSEQGQPAPGVVYAAAEDPPEFLRRAIRAAGGIIEVRQFAPEGPNTDDPPPLAQTVAQAMADLARAVAEEHQVEFTRDGVKSVEEVLSEGAEGPEEDEIGYWSAVVKLGAFAGEVIRLANGGHWQVADAGTLPLSLVTTFRGGQATVNPLGKAIKLFENGPEDSVASLVGFVCSERERREN